MAINAAGTVTPSMQASARPGASGGSAARFSEPGCRYCSAAAAGDPPGAAAAWERMAARGLTPGDVVAAIREQNVQVAAGALGHRHQQVKLVRGELARHAGHRHQPGIAVNFQRAKTHDLMQRALAVVLRHCRAAPQHACCILTAGAGASSTQEPPVAATCS